MKKLEIKKYPNINRMFFGNNNDIKNSIIEKIINQMKFYKIEGEIETTAYPFVLNNKIMITLEDKEEENIFKILNKNKIVDVEYEIDLRKIEQPALKNLTAKYNNNNIILKNYSSLLINNINNKSKIYLLIKITEFKKKEENKIKEYCMESVDKHVDKITGKNKNKNKNKNKTKIKNPNI